MVESDEVRLLKEISHKLDQLIVLTKMGSQEEIKKLKEKVSRDPVLSEIRKLSDGTLPSSEFKGKVAKAVNKSESFIEKGVYELIGDGVIVAMRKGREIYYVSSGLID